MRKLERNYIAVLSILFTVSPVILTDEQCSLEAFDVASLTKSFWAVPTTGSRCSNNKPGCVFMFSICYRGSDLHLCRGSSACFREADKTTPIDGPPILHRIDEESFQVIYEGSNTSVQFECGAQNLVPKRAGNVVETLVGKLIARSVFDTSNYTTIFVDYAGACPKTKLEPKSNTIGPGGQVFVVLLVLGALYFGCGAVYNHVNGARGIELLPHHWFWTNLISYVVDGCLFFVRVITCQRRPAYSQNPDYGAISPSGVSPLGRTYDNL
ncbi:hypothetical protein BIW11_08045 [Tropilaelaps mercedesae]|uniref:Cation-dependent mannose-6-phosphate receptor-like n=1 Tax=Tropilaelaps mercedesae TaxID=418985 RepID=A0A1V9XRC4_9ACAR|nr:hypothetical protein BIW11_08045 [Tropilaelaps mercedesae]